MINLSVEAVTLATRLAEARGITVEEAVKIALEAISEPASGVKKVRRPLEGVELVRRMEEISARSGARPIVDPRSPDELLGYDEFGLPG